MALGIFLFEAYPVMLSGAKHLAQCVHRVCRWGVVEIIHRVDRERENENLHGVYPELGNEILRGVYPELPSEILHFVQDDRRRVRVDNARECSGS